MRSRLEILDGLRFVAALAVVVYHFTTMDRVWQRPAEEIFPSQPGAHGWLGVYLFFLISGFVICMSSWGKGVGTFWLSRVVRLYPAYWLSVVAVAMVLTVWPYVLPQPVGWSSVLANLTMFQEPLGQPSLAEVYWTLWAELRFYLLFTLVVWWGLTYERVVLFCGVWLGAVTVVKALVADATLPHHILMTEYAPLFTGGIGCYLLYRFGSTLMSWGIVVCSFVLSVPAARFRSTMEVAPGVVTESWPAVALLAVCFVLIVAVARGWLSWIRGRWLVVLGATTYPLYLLHMNIGAVLLYHWQRHASPLVLVVFVTAAMIVLAWLVHRYVERPVAPLMKRALLPFGADMKNSPKKTETPVTFRGIDRSYEMSITARRSGDGPT